MIELCENAYETAKVLAMYTGRPVTNFLSGDALEHWRENYSPSAKQRRRYHQSAEYRENQKQKAVEYQAKHKNYKRFENVKRRATINHWWPLVDALERARGKVGVARLVDVRSVYKEVGLKWGKHIQATELWCEWQPKPAKPTPTPEEIAQRQDREREQRRKLSKTPAGKARAKKKWARRRSDPHWQCRMGVARRICDVMRRFNAEKSAHSEELIGCTWGELRQHLEAQFSKGMSWENYGKHWHIDHIIPCAAFDLSDAKQQRLCFNWRNLQPLRAIDNLKKGSRVYAATLPLVL